MSRQLSGIQKQVIKLYKDFLTEIKTKNMETASRIKFQSYIKSEFIKNSLISKKEFDTIEYLIRKGEKQLETFKNSSIDDFNWK
jgi:succinate dehydrogenase assembly factor 1